MRATNGRRLRRVGIAVADLDEARRRFAYALGAEIPEIIESVDESDLTSASDWLRDKGRFVLFEVATLQLVLIEATVDAQAEDRMHHLSFESDAFDEELQCLKNLGGNLVSEGATEGHQRFALLDGREPVSCYLELLEHLEPHY